MPAMSLPILSLAVREQRYSCHGCGNCCRDFTVQLREEDLAKLREQNWGQRLGQPVTIEFRGTTYLRQRDDGACVFLMDNGLCRIHKEFGFEAKPIACQLFPFHITPSTKGLTMGLNFACQSVLENKGAELKSHVKDLGRMLGELPDLAARAAPPMLTDRLRAETSETESLIAHVDAWLRRADLGLPLRHDGLAWVVQSLAQAKLENVRGQRFDELLDVLFGALPEELEHHPIEPPTARQLRMLRQAVFMRTEDPKLNAIERQGRWRTMWSQFVRSRRFKSGRGEVPRIGVDWPEHVRFAEIERIAAAPNAQACEQSHSPDEAIDLLARDPIDDLLTRWLRASVLGNRCWGTGYYGWPMIAGLQALLLDAACVGWLARMHAEGRIKASSEFRVPSQSTTPAPTRDAVLDTQYFFTIDDVRAALGRIDRTHGRAKWLGSAAERLRLTYLSMDDGLRRLIQGYALAPVVKGD
jgi:lysine-N-methylase